LWLLLLLLLLLLLVRILLLLLLLLLMLRKLVLLLLTAIDLGNMTCPAVAAPTKALIGIMRQRARAIAMTIAIGSCPARLAARRLAIIQCHALIDFTL